MADLVITRDEGRHLSEVRAYTGRPDRTKDARGSAAHERQSAAWAESGVAVRWRLLSYPRDWPRSRPREKGVDVAIATDIVSLSLRRVCDVIVVASADTDLQPAIEEVRLRTDIRVEVAGWWGEGARQRLSLAGSNLWCHWLRRDDYEQVRDDTDYTRGRT